jgi:hypothetical protein
MSPTPAPGLIQRILVIVGVILYVLVGVFFYFPAGLVVPGFFVAALWAVWFGGLWFLARLVGEWSWWTLISGPVAFLFWLGYVSAGESVLGWTA